MLPEHCRAWQEHGRQSQPARINELIGARCQYCATSTLRERPTAAAQEIFVFAAELDQKGTSRGAVGHCSGHIFAHGMR